MPRMQPSRQEIDRLFARYQRIARIVPPKPFTRPTFAAFLEAPEFYERMTSDRLSDWADNPRILSFTHTDLILN